MKYAIDMVVVSTFVEWRSETEIGIKLRFKIEQRSVTNIQLLSFAQTSIYLTTVQAGNQIRCRQLRKTMTGRL